MFKSTLNYFSSMRRSYKKLLLLVLDLCVLPVLMWAAYVIRLFDLKVGVMTGLDFWPLLVMLIAVGSLWLMGIYHAVIRSFNENFILRLAAATLITMLCLYVVAKTRIAFVPMSIPIIFAALMFGWVWTSRAIIRIVVNNALYSHIPKARVVIYGAGDAGRQMAVALNLSKDHIPVCFLDDNPNLHGLTVEGLKVYSPYQLELLQKRHQFNEVLLAMPTIAKKRKNEIIKHLEPLGVKVREVPSFSQLVDGHLKISDIKEVDIIDLLGREPVPPVPELLARNIDQKVVMVTGAGGSIGSELCRQIIRQQPQMLILFEMSEFSLYSIDKELRGLTQIKIVPVLGSVFNQKKQYRIMQQYAVQTVYHAAAYKHVPLVEANPLEGLRNNSAGTAKSLNAAVAAHVETFVLISTDKAVRPTNIMGASKRLAELYCQAIAAQQPTTKISIVRFGNVLGSSGSVVPLFKQQIAKGGPITVTHPEVTRYFMTIPEAALLVIQAGAMGEGGDVFLLDMGDSVKIKDLAAQMIALSGLKLKQHADDDGDIEIQFTGLRPGEKLYEELLIEQDKVQETSHERIVKSFEKQFSLIEIQQVIERIEQAYQGSDRQDLDWIITRLEYFVDGYQRGKEIQVN
ncbi:polysaccharide biosynthesis protein [Acinetobacter qingfengensis]|uniref:Capsular biosynthesis protein n=1 Tax=Acinetobacter qingfengensis TaxID=1262585 RepID=A0A1E7RCU0_9GAMM|nr:nucleoside-diphosphate sugar epimerase/dehydratase [Acinetobacter qingfengensis]KAA8732071.1 polysaccharide biosynthesis protein [Acinetobacter qingfengensis]OEY97151.1 capsular biosynthesis protein [Acinetobacter qingfengensis]